MWRRIFYLIGFWLLLFLNPVSANNLPDYDSDGVPDQDEINIYSTDPYSRDTDKDGYSDREELLAGFSPHNPKPVSLADNDQDGDGLSDFWELRFRTNLIVADTDGDGINDGQEIEAATNPREAVKAKLPMRLDIILSRQELTYWLDGVKFKQFPVSTGKPGMPTPKGHFTVVNKYPKAWSKPFGLWMPYWLGLDHGQFGIHELPIWPNGYREGADHLGKPVSHGCIRLGIGPAKYLYDRVDIGTEVNIYY